MHSAEEQEHAGGYYPPDQSQQGQRGSGLMGHSSGSFVAEDRIQNSEFPI